MRIHLRAIFSSLVAMFVCAIHLPNLLAQPSLDVVVTSEPPTDEEDPGGFPIKFFDNYSWRLFVALNWPAAQGQRGKPDTSKTLGDITTQVDGKTVTIPRTWETWKSVEELFLPDGKEPTEWQAFDVSTVCPEQAAGRDATTKTLIGFTKLGNTLADLNQVDDIGFPIGPLIARNRSYVRYEIRMNETEYQFIRNNKYYRRENFPKAGEAPIAFSNGSIEVKAAWREFKLPEERDLVDRYYHTEAWAFNPATNKCEKKEFGLVGFHIAQKTPTRRQWIWSTFEHVDNLSVGSTAPAGTESTFDPTGPVNGDIPPPQPITSSNGPKDNPDPVKLARQHVNTTQFSSIPPPQTREANDEWHINPKIKGTVWENYDLIMTQWPIQQNAPDNNFSPFPSSNVANVTMETYVQSNSCITCHQPTTNNTDFVWFLSIRSFPPLNGGGGGPGLAVSHAAAIRKTNAEVVRNAARKAFEAAKNAAGKTMPKFPGENNQ